MGVGMTASFCAKYFYSSLSSPSPHSQQHELQNVLLQPIERIADPPRRHPRNLHVQLAQNRVQSLLRVVRKERRRHLATTRLSSSHFIIESSAPQRHAGRSLEIHRRFWE